MTIIIIYSIVQLNSYLYKPLNANADHLHLMDVSKQLLYDLDDKFYIQLKLFALVLYISILSSRENAHQGEYKILDLIWSHDRKICNKNGSPSIMYFEIYRVWNQYNFV